MEQGFSLLHKLDLGQHTLVIMSDGSIGLLANGEHTPCLAEHALRLDSDETYRLLVSLQAQFPREEALPERG